MNGDVWVGPDPISNVTKGINHTLIDKMIMYIDGLH